MKHFIPHTCPKTAADQIIADRFGRTYGVTTRDAFQVLRHNRTVAHLNKSQAKRLRRTTGRQHHRAKYSFADDGVLMIAIPVRCPRGNETLWVKTEFTTYLDIIEWGADGAWTMVYKGDGQRAGQVRIRVPCDADGPSHATVARIIRDAVEGQQAHVVDGDPTNLRVSNCLLVGNPCPVDGQSKLSKTDTRAQLQRGLEQRAAAAAKKAQDEDHRQLSFLF